MHTNNLRRKPSHYIYIGHYKKLYGGYTIKFSIITLENALANFLYLELHPWFTWCNALLLHTSIMAIENHQFYYKRIKGITRCL
jgi:hypothetical protein